MAEIAWLEAARVAQLQSFIDQCWRRGHVLARDAELLEWQHRRPSHPDQLSILVASRGEVFEGILGLIEVPWNHFGQQQRGAWIALWVARQEVRGQSIGLKLLARAMAEPYDFLGTLGVNAHALKIYEMMKFNVVLGVPRWVRGVNADALARLLDGTGDFYLAHQRAAMLATAGPWPALSSQTNLRFVDWHQGARAWDQLWRGELAAQRISVDRSSDYLEWRYAAHPRLRYAMRVALDNRTGRAAALVVSRVIDVGGAAARVLRLLEVLGAPEAEDAIAGEIARQAVAADVAMADYYCTSQRSAAALRRLGFVAEQSFDKHWPSLFAPLDCRRSQLTAAFKSRGVSREEFAEHIHRDELYVTRADGDQDRPN